MEQSAWLHGLISVDIWQTKYVQVVAILIRLDNDFDIYQGAKLCRESIKLFNQIWYIRT